VDLKWEKDELFEVVYWLRQIFGLVLGLVWGIAAMTGLVGIGSFLLLNAVGFLVYCTKFLGVDDEEFGRFELLQEGFMGSFGIFLVSWICSYSLLHF